MVINMQIEKKPVIVFLIALLILIFTFFVSLSIGTIYIPFSRVIQIIYNFSNKIEPLNLIILDIRAPRAVLSFLVGSGLAISGVIFQGVIRNPMADPYVIGISAGAGTGVTIAVVFNLNWHLFGLNTIPLMAFLGAIITVFIVYQLSRVGQKIPITTFLLAGVAMGFLLNAFMSFLMVIGSNDLHKIVYWMMGSFATVSWNDITIILPYYITSLLVLVFYLKDLNIILLGEENAHYLGVNVDKVKFILILAATLLAAAVVSVSGIIGFIGLIVPHIGRMLIGPDHRKLMPLSGFIGGIFLLISDDLARSLIPPLEIPVGIITALAGGPYFIYLLMKNKKSW
jgi:iron complex transport system permease protein